MSGSASTEPDMSAPTPASTPTTAAHTALDMAAASVTTASDPSTPAASVATPSTTTASTATPSTPPTETAVRTAREPLRTRDVILIGVYAAVYLVLISIPAAPAHLIPALMPFMGLGCGVFGSIVYLLAVTKSRRFGTATIMGVLLALLMGVIHGNYFTVITALASSVAADLTAGYGKYRGTGTLLESSGIFNLWTVGMALPYMLTRQSHLADLTARYGAEYAQRMGSLFPIWMLPLIIVMAFAGGIIGGWIGHRLLTRHFRRAGLA